MLTKCYNQKLVLSQTFTKLLMTDGSGELMRLGRDTNWETVFEEWKVACPHQPEPNKDIWSLLPDDTQWFCAEIEKADPEKLFIIGSSDWLKSFSTYKLQGVVEAVKSREADDQYRHTSRIKDIASFSDEREGFPKIILVAESAEGPFVAIDGNHRMAGFHLGGCLEGTEVFLGLSQRLSRDFKWFYWAIR